MFLLQYMFSEDCADCEITWEETENTVLCFHCKNNYTKAPQCCYVYITYLVKNGLVDTCVYQTYCWFKRRLLAFLSCLFPFFLH